MNSCILMGEVTQDPQLRYTPDNQTPIAEMWVQFPGLRDDDPPSKLKVVGWGNLAQEIQERYHQGDRIIVEGRLNMNTIDRQEGFKEKRAELTAQRIHHVNADATLTTVASAPSAPAASTPKATPAAPTPTVKPAIGKSAKAESSKPPAYAAPAADPVDYDEIPF
ncbi:single-stranded DNA-binding protein [Leptolyngbya sp. FACHB-711]|uniref:single-stranded DNA-binding protein n=1 Tax=unclassified Leptolyngbya TaxID=2650499 RepID=UPI001688312E|nr:single-stranded DNA-binding protein [Leptolyngbya sp. FACHB-711]MBD1851319.1 single-stranded DNA-binding protein [Cyanobacteria bacterium FACHB-502]MBD2026590.1 single-stranded DNA-binding protein [Leptolyngbya sp. FACHB-711]